VVDIDRKINHLKAFCENRKWEINYNCIYVKLLFNIQIVMGEVVVITDINDLQKDLPTREDGYRLHQTNIVSQDNGRVSIRGPRRFIDVFREWRKLYVDEGRRDILLVVDYDNTLAEKTFSVIGSKSRGAVWKERMEAQMPELFGLTNNGVIRWDETLFTIVDEYQRITSPEKPQGFKQQYHKTYVEGMDEFAQFIRETVRAHTVKEDSDYPIIILSKSQIGDIERELNYFYELYDFNNDGATWDEVIDPNDPTELIEAEIGDKHVYSVPFDIQKGEYLRKILKYKEEKPKAVNNFTEVWVCDDRADQDYAKGIYESFVEDGGTRIVRINITPMMEQMRLRTIEVQGEGDMNIIDQNKEFNAQFVAAKGFTEPTREGDPFVWQMTPQSRIGKTIDPLQRYTIVVTEPSTKTSKIWDNRKNEFSCGHELPFKVLKHYLQEEKTAKMDVYPLCQET
jgi:hypothetical protein